jgi:ribonucleoside-diphosphate reductase subunit M2
MSTLKNQIEPLLTPDESRYVMFPIKYPDIWNMYLKQVDCFWRAEEIDLSKDTQDWDNLNEDERFFISKVLAYFAASDGLIVENLAERFLGEVQNAEARAFYGFQIAMENIHSQTYSLLIDTYIKDESHKTQLLGAIQHYDCIKRKSMWAQKWINDRNSNFATRLVAFACIEGIFFSGAFCSIFWLKKRGLMPGLTFSNELISRDEALHTEFAVLLYSKLVNPCSKEEVTEIIREAVELECYFIIESLPCRLIGMNNDMMTKYIKFCADRLSLQLGYDKIYYENNPFDFMDLISLEGKTNFFDKKVSDYALANNSGIENAFEMTEDF